MSFHFLRIFVAPKTECMMITYKENKVTVYFSREDGMNLDFGERKTTYF